MAHEGALRVKLSLEFNQLWILKVVTLRVFGDAALLNIHFVPDMSDDQSWKEEDEILSKTRRYATVGRSQAEKRRALSNIPSWEQLSGMNLDLPSAEVTKADITRAAKRYTVSVSPSGEPLSGNSDGTYSLSVLLYLPVFRCVDPLIGILLAHAGLLCSGPNFVLTCHISRQFLSCADNLRVSPCV